MTLMTCSINQEDKALYYNDARLYFFAAKKCRQREKYKCRNLEMLPWGQVRIRN